MSTTATTSTPSPHYLAPDRGTLAFNRVALRLSKMGLSIRGSRILTVVGRRSGEPRSTVVNPLPFDGHRYLVAPRGTTDWVRNLRAAGRAELRLGRRREQVVAVELQDEAKVPLLREYLRRWAFEVGAFFDGVGADATDEELAAIAHKHPVFEVVPA